MENLNKNPQNSCSISHKRVVDEQFEHNAGVKIYNKDKYSGGSGFYSTKPNAKCPNVYDNMNQPNSGSKK
jgi:hypothetical protein